VVPYPPPKDDKDPVLQVIKIRQNEADMTVGDAPLNLSPEFVADLYPSALFL
jgi:hypothetical protein